MFPAYNDKKDNAEGESCIWSVSSQNVTKQLKDKEKELLKLTKNEELKKKIKNNVKTKLEIVEKQLCLEQENLLFSEDKMRDSENAQFESLQQYPTYKCIFKDFKDLTRKRLVRYFEEKMPLTLLDEKGDNNEHHFFEIQSQNKYFFEKLAINSRNLQMWIDFVNFQDLKLPCDPKNSGALSVLLDIKLSILNEAIEKNKMRFVTYVALKSNNISKNYTFEERSLFMELLIMRQELLRMSLSREEMMASWQETVKEWSGDFLLWQKFFEYLEMYGESTDQVIDLYKKAFHVFRNNTEVLLDLYEKLIEFLDMAGYTELAVSIMQIMISWNLKNPLNHLKLQEKMEILEVYWSSGVGGFGESCWVNLENWIKIKGMTSKDFFRLYLKEKQNHIREKEIVKENNNDISKVWNKLEFERSSKHWLPWKVCAEECEDEERMIMFEDLKGFLFLLSHPDEQFYIVLKFFLFLIKHSSAACFCHEELLKSKVDLLVYIKKFSFLESGHLVHKFENFRVLFDEVNQVINGIFTQAISFFDGIQKKTLVHLYLSYKLHCCGIKEIKKIYKNLLKNYPDDITLWVKYAEFEATHGDRNQALKVIYTHLKAPSSTLTDNSLIFLVRKLFQIQIEAFELTKNIKCFLSEKMKLKSNNTSFNLTFLKENEIKKYFSLLSSSQLLDIEEKQSIDKWLLKLIEIELDSLSSKFSDFDKIQKGYPICVFTSLMNDKGSSLCNLVYILSLIFFSRPSSQLNFLIKLYSKIFQDIRNKKINNLIKNEIIETLICHRWDLFVFFWKKGDSRINLKNLVNMGEDDLIILPESQVILWKYLKLMGGHVSISLSKHLKSLNVLRFVYFLAQFLKNPENSSLINKTRNFIEKLITTDGNQKAPEGVWDFYFLFQACKDPLKIEEIFYRASQQFPFNKRFFLYYQWLKPYVLSDLRPIMRNRRIRTRTLVEEVFLLRNCQKLFETTHS